MYNAYLGIIRGVSLQMLPCCCRSCAGSGLQGRRCLVAGCTVCSALLLCSSAVGCVGQQWAGGRLCDSGCFETGFSDESCNSGVGSLMLIVSVCGMIGWILSVEVLRMASCRIRTPLDWYGYCSLSFNRSRKYRENNFSNSFVNWC